jgi:hypothetical protein
MPLDKEKSVVTTVIKKRIKIVTTGVVPIEPDLLDIEAADNKLYLYQNGKPIPKQTPQPVKTVGGQTIFGAGDIPLPQKISDLQNDSGFVTNLVNDLVNYYTSEQIDAKLSKKVDKVEGKSLVSDALIAKMEGIQDKAVIKSVGAGLALSAEKELSVDAETIPAIAIAKVTGLQAALDAKQTAEQVSAAIASAKIKSSQIEGTVASAATADKMANALTVGGKVYNGSEAVEVTAADLGALTEIPQATEAALGGIKIGHAAGANEAALKLDEEGKAYVDIPAAVVYTAKENGGLEMDASHAFSIKEVSTDLLKQGAKTLVLDGGTAFE